MKQYIHICFLVFSFLFFITCHAADDEVIDTSNVINILDKKFNMFDLLQDIAQTLHSEVHSSSSRGQVSMRIQFDQIINETIVRRTVVRNIDMVNKEKDDQKLLICQLALAALKLSNKSPERSVVSDDVQDAISIVSDPQIQEAAQVVSSFAVSMAHADTQKKSGETTESYVLRMFVMVFTAAQKSGVIQKIPVLLEGCVHLLGDVVEVGEVVVHKVKTKCCPQMKCCLML